MKNILVKDIRDFIRESESLSDAQLKHMVRSFSTENRLEDLREQELFEPGFNFDYLGSDCFGGYVFFGNKEQADEVCSRIKSYFEQSSRIQGEFCLVFEHDGFYAVILYDDYIQPADLDQIIMDNVLYTSFGAWSDDIALNYILEEDDECEYWMSIGTEKYDQSKHSNLRTKAQALVKFIFSELVENNV